MSSQSGEWLSEEAGVGRGESAVTGRAPRPGRGCARYARVFISIVVKSRECGARTRDRTNGADAQDYLL
jgi:hypothetical protein